MNKDKICFALVLSYIIFVFTFYFVRGAHFFGGRGSLTPIVFCKNLLVKLYSTTKITFVSNLEGPSLSLLLVFINEIISIIIIRI